MAKHMKTMDGNTAASYISYAFTDVATIYPITPSSTMAEIVDEWASQGKKNIFGQTVKVTEMQSEAGAAGAMHGSLSAGALTSTYTASQGLLLMIPNIYKIAGELLPGVFHVSARALASHALSIFGDHQDVMAARQTGACLLASGSVQEVMDLSAISHLAALKSSLPFINFFDGFRTSHEIQKIEVLEYDDLKKLVDFNDIQKFKDRALSPNSPITKGTAQNPDVYFQNREAINPYYDAVPKIVENYMREISKLTGRDYKPFVYYGAPDAEHVVVAIGSITQSLEETVDYLNAKGKKTGIIKVHLYRPFSAKYFFDVLPKSVKKIAVLDRTKEAGAVNEPLAADIKSIFYNADMAEKPVIVGGRYGLGSKDTTPAHLVPVFENLENNEPKDHFTIAIVDDVTNLSLPTNDSVKIQDEGTVRCKFWGLGSDGTVGANKQAIKIIGDNTDMYAQGYFDYDSKKSGGVTVSHLRFGKTPIRSTYLIDEADFIACHSSGYTKLYNLTEGLKKGGSFVLNCPWSDEELNNELPNSLKKYIAENEIHFYTIDATKIAKEIGLGGRINMIMQSAFFKLANVMDYDKAKELLKESIVKAYGKKGEDVVQMNYKAVDSGSDNLHKVEVPSSWSTLNDGNQFAKSEDQDPEFIKEILRPINGHAGDKIPVSAFVGYEDGHIPSGTAQYEKRGIADVVPKWIPENCIQCNQCSFVCPHAVVRPFLLNEDEKAAAPESFKTIKAVGKELDGLEYRIQISPMDCTGCGNCADICPGKKGEKALIMTSFDEMKESESDNWEFAHHKVGYKNDIMTRDTVKGSQFMQPLLEFSGACAGCGETAYVKAVTQMFGDRMIIANATGCSSIWGASAPSSPYTHNIKGQGPAWANSLFEDNAEYGLGMVLADKAAKAKLENLMKELIESGVSDDVKNAFNKWIDNKNGEHSEKIAAEAKEEILKVLDSITGDGAEKANAIRTDKEFLDKRSFWIIGGDGWAYDIGYGGLDHVLASGENVNVMVLDTEIYSNTGGQSSKSTPTAAVAKFAASGKKIRKKDLGLMATTYGYVYVAQVSIGSNKNHFMKVLKEAESFDGPSLILCYAPCISHGLKTGMGKSVQNEKEAVDSGYWHLFRYDPRLEEEGKNPFVLDSAEPTESFRDFIGNQVRYTSLMKTSPDNAEELYAAAEKEAKKKYERYLKLSEM